MGIEASTEPQRDRSGPKHDDDARICIGISVAFLPDDVCEAPGEMAPFGAFCHHLYISIFPLNICLFGAVITYFASSCILFGQIPRHFSSFFSSSVSVLNASFERCLCI